jgi:hypothetical protein
VTFQLTCGGIPKAAAEAKAAAQAKAATPAPAPAASNEAEDYALMGTQEEHLEGATEAQQSCNRGATDLEDLASIVCLARRQCGNDGIATDEEELGGGGEGLGEGGSVGIPINDVQEEETIVFRPRAKSTDGVHTDIRIREEVSSGGSATQKDPSHAAAGFPSTKVLAY